MNLQPLLNRFLFGRKEQILFRHDHEAIAARLFGQAAQAHKGGDANQAMVIFQVSVSLYEQANERVPLDYLLRLPTYWVALGCPHKAWQHYRQLLASFTSDEKTQQPLMMARIFDKMRLFQQRQSQYDRALVYSALAYVARNQGLARQARLKELTGWSRTRNVEYGLRLAMNKATKSTRQAIFHRVMQVETRLITLDLAQFEAELLAFT